MGTVSPNLCSALWRFIFEPKQTLASLKSIYCLCQLQLHPIHSFNVINIQEQIIYIKCSDQKRTTFTPFDIQSRVVLFIVEAKSFEEAVNYKISFSRACERPYSAFTSLNLLVFLSTLTTPSRTPMYMISSISPCKNAVMTSLWCSPKLRSAIIASRERIDENLKTGVYVRYNLFGKLPEALWEPVVLYDFQLLL